jgi:hypothetical protein
MIRSLSKEYVKILTETAVKVTNAREIIQTIVMKNRGLLVFMGLCITI